MLELTNLQIEQDFKELYPGREDGLISKWDMTKTAVIDLLKTEILKSDQYGRKLLSDLIVTDAGIFLKKHTCCAA